MTISVLQMVSGEDTSAASDIPAGSVTVAANSYLHVAFTHSGVVKTITAVNSSPALTWGQIDRVEDATDDQVFEHWQSSATSAGAVSVTATLDTSASFRGWSVKEIGGSSGYDGRHAAQFQPTPGTGTDAVTSGATAALSAQPALFSGFAQDSQGSSGTPAVGTGYTSDGVGWNFAGNLLRGESRRVTATTGLAATFTAGAASRHMSAVAAFLETGAGGGGGNVLMGQVCT